MENSVWLKPTNGENKANFKKQLMKSLMKDELEATVTECIYLDTLELDLLKQNMVFMLQSREEGVFGLLFSECQGNELEIKEKLILPENSISIELFGEETQERLNAVLAGKPLFMQCAVAFEVNAQTSGEENQSIEASQYVCCFKDDGQKCKLYTFQLKDASGNNSLFYETADKLGEELNLTRCPNPFSEALRISASGFKPLINDKYKKYKQENGLAQVFSTRVFNLINSYIWAMRQGMAKEALHKLRLQARKTISMLEAFQSAFNTEAHTYTRLIEEILDKTGPVRTLDVLLERIQDKMQDDPALDLNELYEKLEKQRAEAAQAIVHEYKQGQNNDLISLWLYINRTAELWKEGEKEKSDIKAAFSYIKDLTESLAGLKKSSFADARSIHNIRINIKKIRYFIEIMEDNPKKLRECVAILKKLQDAYGIITDHDECIRALYQMALSSRDNVLAYACGICTGIFTMVTQHIYKEAYPLWKEYRPLLEKLAKVL